MMTPGAAKRLAGRAALLAAALVLAGVGRPASERPADEFLLERDVAVPMRDGVVLRADIRRPRGAGRRPVLVYRTPYDKQAAQEDYTIFRRAVERGYAVVIQDVRGRYASAGEFRPYQQEGRDGYDTIEWAARQPWSNGAVGTFGLSYPGAVQWLAAKERPPHLKAMAPAMTFSSPRNFFYSGGVFDLSWIGWIWNNIAPHARLRRNLPGPKTYAEARAEWVRRRDRLRGHLPLQELPDLKEVAPFYYEWMSHPPEDRWWEWCELRGHYEEIDAAVLNLSGWYDEAYGPEGALTNFLGLAAARRHRGELRAKLVLGPWSHGVEETSSTAAGLRQFGPQAAIDYDEVVLRWMDRYVKGVENGVDREKPVEVFVMGRNRWERAETWPLPGARSTPLYLAAPAAPGEHGRLRWSQPAETGSFRSFLSDPANPVTDLHPPYSGAQDYRAMAHRPDVLIYETPPLEDDLEVTGPITAQIYLGCDAPDTDLWVRLLDVAPDGTALNLMSPGLDLIRASYRQPGRRRLLAPGRVYKLELANLVTSNVFRRGHRLRVQISSSFFPHFSRNLHTGESEVSSAEMRQARLRIYHNRRYPSRLLLPVRGPR